MHGEEAVRSYSPSVPTSEYEISSDVLPASWSINLTSNPLTASEAQEVSIALPAASYLTIFETSEGARRDRHLFYSFHNVGVSIGFCFV